MRLNQWNASVSALGLVGDGAGNDRDRRTAILPYAVNAVAATSTLAAFGGTDNIGNNSVLPATPNERF
jgi:hypothetical protein